MLHVTYIFFWILLPLASIYFRLKKRISTGFAIGLVLTSFFLGYITANTFQERNEERLVRLLNEKKLTEAENVLMWIVQKNPQDINRIDSAGIHDPHLFREMKNKLGTRYIAIATEIMNTHRISKSSRCDDIDEHRNVMAKLEHARRLLAMAGSLGKGRKDLEDILRERIGEGKRTITRLEADCR